MIADDGKVDGSVKKMENEDGVLKKVECLRGRLIAERAASKLAKQEAQQMECKVDELETQLKSEIKSRKRADKKLLFVINKLHSLNIPYFSKDSEKSDKSSVSSSVSYALTQVDDKDPKALTKTCENGESELIEKKGSYQTECKDFQDCISQISTSNHSAVDPTGFEPCQNRNNADVDDQSLYRLRSSDQKEDANEENSAQMLDKSQSSPIEEEKSYVKKDNSAEFNENSPKIDDQSFCSSRDAVEEKKNTKGKRDEAQDDYVDESLALVLVDLPEKAPQVHIDPLILDENVKQVLNALGHAKRRLLLSMERRHMIRVGSK